MVKRSAKLIAIYLVGLVLVGGWSVMHVVQDTVTRENAAGVIVFPLAWLFGYWPTVMPAVLAHRIWRLQSTVQRLAERRSIGLATDEEAGEIEDTLTLLAAQENGVPEKWARPFVRRVMRVLQDRPAAG